MQNLPSHRQLLTSLITSISSIPPQPANDTTAPPSPSAAPHPPPPTSSSPLQNIPPADRPLLLTLHVLFPTLLLPALDLLDRALVQRLLLPRNQDNSNDGGETVGSHAAKPITAGDAGVEGIFLVRSIASTMTRRGRDTSASSQRYVVHLGAWNCSCASFALDAFPAHPVLAQGQGDAEALGAGAGWTFGGMSLDGVGSSAGDVPCCKHLLACLLADKWPVMLARFVQDRKVTKEEMAGIAADM